MMIYHILDTRLTKIVLGLIFLSLLLSCNTKENSTQKNTNAQTEVKKTFDDVYNYYRSGDLRWVDSYNDTFTVINDKGSAITGYADSLRKQWKNIYKKYDVIVRKPGEPTIIASGNEALHYNSVSEMFVNKATHDTADNTGTWIALWKKQSDNSWKIVFETYQARPTDSSH